MANAINKAIGQIQKRIKALTVELDQLRQAESALRSLPHLGEPAQPPETPPKPKRKGKITLAVAEAVQALGQATTAQVIAYLHTHYDPGANKNSIRSLLSVGRQKGLFLREGGKYRLAEKTAATGGLDQ